MRLIEGVAAVIQGIDYPPTLLFLVVVFLQTVLRQSVILVVDRLMSRLPDLE